MEPTFLNWLEQQTYTWTFRGHFGEDKWNWSEVLEEKAKMAQWKICKQ